MKVFRLLVLLLLVLLVGCTPVANEKEFKLDTLTADDLCIVKIEGSKSTICRGMKRIEVEQLLGKAISDMPLGLEYIFGVTIGYIDDSVATLTLTELSKGHFKTARGTEIGMLKSEVKDLFGKMYASEPTDYELGYFYNTEKQRFEAMHEEGLDNKSNEEKKKTNVFYAVFDNTGYVSRITLADRHALEIVN